MKSHVDSQSPGSPNGVDAYVHFFYNQAWQELESRVSASENTGPESLQPQYQYVWSQRYIDAPVLRDKNTDADGLCDDERIYFLGDANFNVTTLVDTGGDALERYVYSPYGVLTIYDATWANVRSTSSYANPYTYTGRQFDSETGLYHYRARFYAAQLGRFCSRDPIGYEGGKNRLAYVLNRPITLVDPNGQWPLVFPWDPRANLWPQDYWQPAPPQIPFREITVTCIYSCTTQTTVKEIIYDEDDWLVTGCFTAHMFPSLRTLRCTYKGMATCTLKWQLWTPRSVAPICPATLSFVIQDLTIDIGPYRWTERECPTTIPYSEERTGLTPL